MVNDFVSLHTHTHCSILDGFSTQDEYIDEAIKLGQIGLGVTDHGNLHGIYKFMNAAKSKGIIPIPGEEFYVAPINPEGAKVQHPVYYGKDGKQNPEHDVSSNGAYLHLTVWAYTTEGLHNLFKLSTLSNDPERFYKKPRIDFDLLADHSEGLIVSTGCPSSEISTRFLMGQDDKAYEYARRLKEVFGENLYVEIMDHKMPIDLETKLLPKQVKLAKDLGIELLATNDCHYAHEHDDIHHEEMLCSQSLSRMSEPTYNQGGKRFAFSGNQYYLKSADEMAELFPEDKYPRALSNTVKIAEKAKNIKLEFDPHLKPKPRIPEEFNNDELAYYKHLINEGYKKHYGSASPEIKAEAKRRINEEMKVIHSSDFIGYMLVVRDYLTWTEDNYSVKDENGEIIASSLGPGRGSVGGSIHALLLGISNVEPIQHDLLFSRFLSAGRGDTYRITYDDGTTEEIIVSNEKTTINNNIKEQKYIHQLKIGDEILTDD